MPTHGMHIIPQAAPGMPNDKPDPGLPAQREPIDATDDFAWLIGTALVSPQARSDPEAIHGPEYSQGSPPSQHEEPDTTRWRIVSARTKLYAKKIISLESRLTPLRQEVQLLRNQAHYALDALKDQRGFARVSQNDFMNELPNLLQKFPDSDALDRVQLLSQRVEQDQATVSRHETAFAELENVLGEAEYRLVRKEGSYIKATHRLSDALQQSGILIEGKLTAPSMSNYSVRSSISLTRSPEEVHPSLQLYFDKVGESKFMRERLSHVVMEHREQRVQREAQIDQGQDLQDTSDENKRDYSHDLFEVETALAEATLAVQTARNECLDHGIDLGPYEDNDPEQTGRTPITSVDQVTPRAADTPSSLALDIPIITPSSLPLLRLNDETTHRHGTNNELLPGDIHTLRLRDAEKANRTARIVDWVQNSTDPSKQDNNTAGSQNISPRGESEWTSLQTLFDQTYVTKDAYFERRRHSVHATTRTLQQHSDITTPSPLPRADSAQDCVPMIVTQDVADTSRQVSALHNRRTSDSQLSTITSRHDSLVDAIKELRTKSSEDLHTSTLQIPGTNPGSGLIVRSLL
ncbi:hypothetical protein LTR27_008724 [Elasticomyces elasticus]|nr:hypothetical protein LTR27_008724 [Elasticomyces elasticus]